MVDVTLISDPEGAIVYNDDNGYVGQAPVPVTVKEGQRTKFVFKLKGYRDTTILVDGLKRVESKSMPRRSAPRPSSSVDPDLKGLDDDLAKPRGM
jgi:hypothetical protein